jgi:hypothetical protein
MLPDKSVKPLVLEIKASQFLLIIQLGLYVLSLFVIFNLINTHLLWEIILSIFTSAYVIYLQYKTVGGHLTGNEYILTLYQNYDGLLERTGKTSTDVQKLHLLGSSWVSNFIIILHFTTDKNRQMYLTLLKDSMSRDDHRKLRVSLNQARLTEGEISAE